ncbi:MAG: hypothetical protein LAT82_02485 [Nanoarchaeota archaeon]|nr:hypothetical protein [Nanoarchaeota archaeon]
MLKQQESTTLNAMIEQALEEHYQAKYINNSPPIPRNYGKIHFDLDSFTGLKGTNGQKPYQSRGSIPVRFEGDGRSDLELVIIHFQPKGGTGSLVDYQGLVDLDGNPLLPQQTPRNKRGIEGEIMFPLVDLNGFEGEQIASTSLDYITLMPTTDDPLMLELGFLDSEKMGKGIIERNFGKHDGTFEGQFDPQVCRTFYHNGLFNVGSPHAIYNPKPYDQVAGFLGFSKQ